MSSKEFWEDDPKLYWAYRDFYILKQQTDNNNMWLMGRYIFDAMGRVINNAFSKETMDYIEKPYKLFEDEEETRKEETRKGQDFNKWARMI